MTDWKELCRELSEHLALLDEPPHQLVCKVEKALAQSEPDLAVELTDQELLRCAKIATPCYDLKAWERELRMMRAAIAADRARFGGHSTPVPAEGEVAEIVELLRESVVNDDEHSSQFEPQFITRIADLLELLSNWVPTDECLPPKPAPVTEKLPESKDCDAEGKCWWFNPGQPAMSNPHIATSSWRLCRMLSGKPMGTHWTPANSLPLPNKGAE